MIRYAENKDYKEVEKIMKQVHKMHVDWRPEIYKMSDLVLPQDVYYDMINNKNIIVAESEEKVIGLLIYFIRHIESSSQVKRDVLFVDSIAVDEHYRGLGIGHALLDFIKDFAKENHVNYLELQVNAKNIKAKTMYEKYGFSEKSITMELEI